MSVKTLLNNEKLSLSNMKSMKGVRNFRPHSIHFFQNVFFYSPRGACGHWHQMRS